MTCPRCNGEVLDIDVKCKHCGAALGSTGAHRMLGQLVLGTYELVDILGQGGMSVVFKARHKLTEQEVALKILPPELAAHSQVKSRFLEEARALAALDHPNIVHLYNFGQENGSFVLAMQFVQGNTWERMILEQQRLDWSVSCRMAVDVLRALEYAHGRGVIHRDMKPSNVLVRSHDGSATVMDFGIAKMTTSSKLTATGQTMGTVRYMSPEQVRGQEVNLRTDIYSLGATLYESLVGETPFDGETHFEIMTKHLSETPKSPRKLGIAIPVDIETALMRSLAKKAADRFESARDMRKMLEAALRDGDVALVDTQRLSADTVGSVRAARLALPSASEASRPSEETVASRRRRNESASPQVRPTRQRRWPWLVGVLLVLGGGAAGMGWWFAKRNARYEIRTAIDGVTFTAGNHLEGLRAAVETDGKIDVETLARAYRATLAELGKVDAFASLRLDIVDVVVAVPQPALCEKTAYPLGAAPEDCKTALTEHAISNEGLKRLYVVDNPAQIDKALRIGVADAQCAFQLVDAQRANQICDAAAKLGAN